MKRTENTFKIGKKIFFNFFDRNGIRTLKTQKQSLNFFQNLSDDEATGDCG